MLALMLSLTALVAQQAPKDVAKDAPKEPDPLAVKLVAKVAKVKLDLQGMTEDDYKKAAKAGTVKPIRTFLEVEITNTSKKTIGVKRGGFSTTEVKLALSGPSVVESKAQKTELKGVFGQRDRSTSAHVLKPGESMKIRIVTLTSQQFGSERHLYVTQAGKYLLQASVKMRVYLDYESTARPGSTTALDLKAAPVELTVE